MRALAHRIYEGLATTIAPGLEYSQTTYGDCLQSHATPGVRWLDVGCGHQLLPSWDAAKERAIVANASLLVGIDPDAQAIREHFSISHRATGWGDAMPFESESFDLVTMNMVVEHLEFPVRVFQEVFRVLRPGGICIFHTPNRDGYATQIAAGLPEAAKVPLARLLHGRVAADVYPTHYRCNRDHEIIAVARESKLEVKELRYIRSSALTAMIAPVAMIELLWLRALGGSERARQRPNLIGILRRPG